MVLCDFDMRRLRRTLAYLLTYLLTYLQDRQTRQTDRQAAVW